MFLDDNIYMFNMQNEEENIEKCLVSLKNTGLELIVVDTVLPIKQRKLLKNIPTIYMISPGAMILPAAKNYAISKASNDMVMVIDSDEYLDQIDIPALEQMNSEKSRIK